MTAHAASAPVSAAFPLTVRAVMIDLDGTLLDTAACVCAITGESRISSGLPPNTEGKTLAITVAGDFTDAVEIGGVALRALALPYEVYS